MIKRLFYSGGALAAAYLVGSLTLGGALAQTSPAQQTGAQNTGSPDVEQAGSPADAASEATESAALAAQAKIGADQAKAAALTKVPGATVGKIELGSENGVVSYDVQLTDSAGVHQDVTVDATTGAVLASETDAPETPGAAEGSGTAD